MSTILDMNSRIRQNAALLPSKRKKFKEHNRETIYTNSVGKLAFKKVSDREMDKIVAEIRVRAKNERIRRYMINGVLLFLGIISFVSFIIFMN